MSTIKSSNEHLTFNADGSSRNILFQANGTQKASISSAGLFTSTTIDATVLTGALPAISGASLTNLPADATKLSLAGGAMTGGITSTSDITIGNTYISSNSSTFNGLKVPNNGYIGCAAATGMIQFQGSGITHIPAAATIGGTLSVTGTLTGTHGVFDTANASSKIQNTNNNYYVWQNLDSDNTLNLKYNSTLLYSYSPTSTNWDVRGNWKFDKPINIDGHTGSVKTILEGSGNGDAVILQFLTKANNGSTSTQGLYSNAGSTSAGNTIVLGNSGSSSDGLLVDISGNVGIGTAAPQNFLHVASGDSSTNTFRTGADTPLIIESTGTACYYGIVADAGQPMGIVMGDSSNSNDTASGAMIYDSDGDGLKFKSGGSTRMKLPTAGNLNVVGNVIFGANGRGLIEEDGTTVRYKNTHSGGTLNLMTHDGNEDIQMDPSGWIRFETAGGNRLRIDSDGIKFGNDTAAANGLDDYEEGTWTPVIRSSGAVSGQSYDIQEANYTKIGRMVYYNLEVRFTNKGSMSGNFIKITGLPYTPMSSPPTGKKFYCSAQNDGRDSGEFVIASIYGGNAFMYLYEEDYNSQNQVSTSNMTNTTFYCTSGHYPTS